MDPKSKYTQPLIDSDAYCMDCNCDVLHLQSLELYDYFVYCTNTSCKNYEGEDVGAMDCPDWVMHVLTTSPWVDDE